MTDNPLRMLEKSFGADVAREIELLREVDSDGADDGYVYNAPDRTWDVRSIFDAHEALSSYLLAQDALPRGAMPVAEDWGGNLYCQVYQGSTPGAIVWCNHETGEGGDSPAILLVSDSLQRFVAGLVKREA